MSNEPANPSPDCETPLPVTLAFDQGGDLSQQACGVMCPSDGTELQIGALAGCQFAGCPTCQGMLIQQPVFASALAHFRAQYGESFSIPAPMNAAQLNIVRHCPACHSKFETYPYAGAGNSVIDACTSCGLLWLDAGELNNLVTAPGKR